LKILSVDLGDARTGIAVCDKFEMLASPVGVIHEKNMDVLLKKVAAIVLEQKAERIVVGYPKKLDNSVGERAEKCAAFAEKLEKKTGVPAALWDERNTTVAATNILNTTDTRGKKRKDVIDAVAAVLILESYMAYRKANPTASSQ